MKPLGEVIQGFEVSCHQCADDTEFCFSWTAKPAESVEVMNSYPMKVAEWIRTDEFEAQSRQESGAIDQYSSCSGTAESASPEGGSTPLEGVGLSL